MYENFNAKQMRIKSLDNEIKKIYNFIHQEANAPTGTNQGNYQVIVPYAITKECINELNRIQLKAFSLKRGFYLILLTVELT